MKIKPILFSTEMVQAILAGRKSQTRRIIKPQPELQVMGGAPMQVLQDLDPSQGPAGYTWKGTRYIPWPKMFIDVCCPYGRVGDILWVRETWVKACEWDGNGNMPPLRYYYRADEDWRSIDWHDENNDSVQDSPTWKPSIFMPKDACRIFLRITDERVERLQDISEEDAIAEGCRPEVTAKIEPPILDEKLRFGMNLTTKNARERYANLWESINGAESFKADPWVWVITFERVEKPADW